MHRFYPTFLLVLLLYSCTSKKEQPQNNLPKSSVFPEVKMLSELQNTEFLLTLEHPINQEQNAIYCATFLFVWDQIKQAVKGPITVNNDTKDLQLVNNLISYKNVLKESEYETETEINGLEITARSYFRKSLPFEYKLNSYDNELTFNDTSITAFGAFNVNYCKNTK